MRLIVFVALFLLALHVPSMAADCGESLRGPLKKDGNAQRCYVQPPFKIRNKRGAWCTYKSQEIIVYNCAPDGPEGPPDRVPDGPLPSFPLRIYSNSSALRPARPPGDRCQVYLKSPKLSPAYVNIKKYLSGPCMSAFPVLYPPPAPPKLPDCVPGGPPICNYKNPKVRVKY
jgi:hypothetical protein